MNPLAALLARYGPRPAGHAVWVVLGGVGALGVAWELPSPDHAVPGLWAVALAIATAAGAARHSVRVGVVVGVGAAAGCGACALGAWAIGGWGLVAVSAAAVAVGWGVAGREVFTVGPVWLAARLLGAEGVPPG